MKALIFSIVLFIGFKGKSQILQTFNHGGLTRTYTYYIPSTWSTGDQLPLLVVLHGLTQTGGGVMDITQFNQLAEENNFIVCYPNGISNAWNANMNVSVSSANDKGFIDALITHFQQNLNTNPNKQYLCGFSNGAFMSYKLACESDHCFAGIATVSGTMSDTVYSSCIPQRLTSILHVHGTADPVVPYIGSPTTGASVNETLEKWRIFLNCSSSTSTIDLPNTNLLDLSTAQRITYTNCSGHSLEHIKVTGGGHQWPGISTWAGGVGTINMDFYSPEIIWAFLSTKSCLTNSLDALTKSIQIHPNPTSDWLTFEGDWQNIEITIRDMNGFKLLKAKINSIDFKLPIKDLANGIYFIDYQSESTYHSIRFIKQ